MLSINFFGKTLKIGVENEKPNDPISTPSYDHVWRVAVVGDQGAGKSSLILRATDDTYTESFISTLISKSMNLTANEERVKLEITECGQTRFRTQNVYPYSNVHAAIILYDVTDQVSFTNAKEWLRELDRYAKESTIKVIVGTKSDLTTKRVVSLESAEELANSLGFTHKEISAKTGANVNELVDEVVAKIYNQEVRKGNTQEPQEQGRGCMVM